MPKLVSDSFTFSRFELRIDLAMKPRMLLYVAICLVVAGFSLLFLGQQDKPIVNDIKSGNTSISVIQIKKPTDTLPWNTYGGFAFIGVGLVLAAANLRIKEENNSSSSDVLTTKEKEIVDAITSGLSNKEIAQKLFVSLNTIKTHNSNIYKKLGVNSRAQLIEKLNK